MDRLLARHGWSLESQGWCQEGPDASCMLYLWKNTAFLKDVARERGEGIPDCPPLPPCHLFSCLLQAKPNKGYLRRAVLRGQPPRAQSRTEQGNN